jgi:hypothetical protein
MIFQKKLWLSIQTSYSCYKFLFSPASDESKNIAPCQKKNSL